MNIDFSKEITVEAQKRAEADQAESLVVSDINTRRALAAQAITPLQYSADIDEASEEDLALLKLWKKHVIALSKVPRQPDYPKKIDWPVGPA